MPEQWKKFLKSSKATYLLIGISILLAAGLLFFPDQDAGKTEPEQCSEILSPDAYTEQLFSAFLKGYLSVRTLSELECAAAWDIYTLYHGLWFTRIVYKDSALDALVKEKNYEAANRLLNQMLSDMEEANDGRFNVGKGRVTMNVNKLIESWKAEE